jgi:hypothetical protein
MTKTELEKLEVWQLMDKLERIQAIEQMIKNVIRAKIYSVEKPR